MEKKKLNIIFLSLLCILIILIITGTYAFFSYAREGEVVNFITLKGLKVNILSEDDNVLSLENAYPMYDYQGLEQTPFVFEVINETSKDISYQIKIDSDIEKLNQCRLSDGSNCSELSMDSIRVAYQTEDNGYSSPQVLGENQVIADSIVITPGETQTYSILLWISSDSGNEIMNSAFFGKIILEGGVTE